MIDWSGLLLLVNTLAPGDAYAGVGSRKTPPEMLEVMRKVAGRLSARGLVLRSGGARGADQAFEAGVPEGGAKEIFLPSKGFASSTSRLYRLPDEAFEIAAQFHPRWAHLSSFERQLMARNSQQVMGGDLRSPSKFVLCWTKDGRASGGTGQAIRVAQGNGIPVFNLRTM